MHDQCLQISIPPSQNPCSRRRRRHRARRVGQPESHQACDSPIPTIPEMTSVPTTVAHLAAWTRTAQQSSPGTIRTVSLPHMVHDLVMSWAPATSGASPTCRLEYTLIRQSYSDLNLSLPMKKNKPVRKVDKYGVTDTGAQMNIAPAEMMESMGISIPVKSRISRPSAEPIAILGGVLLQLKGINEKTGNIHTSHQLFYVAFGCKHVYLSLDTCIAIGVVPGDFPQVGTFGNRLPHSRQCSSCSPSQCCCNIGPSIIAILYQHRHNITRRPPLHMPS